jgi:biopolymer transport protein ExbD
MVEINTERNSPMTEQAVELSITVKVNGEVIQYSRKIEMQELESRISQVVQGPGNKVLVAGLKGLGLELSKRMPAG